MSTRPRTIQELVHWLELGGGARWVRVAAVLVGTLVLSLVVAWKQFHGPVGERTLLQADLGRQLARGEGFTTLVNHPQSAAFLREHGRRFDAAAAYPDLHHAPLYPLMIAGALRLWPEAARARLFTDPPQPPDGFLADYFLLGLNLVLLWLAAWLVFTLARSLFGPPAAWLASLGLLLSVPVWQQTVAVNGTPLMMVLGLWAFHVWRWIDVAADEPGLGRRRAWSLALLGLICGLLFLADYPAGVLSAVALGYAWRRFSGAARVAAVGAILGGLLSVTAPWLIRNVQLTGHPLALASQEIALKAGDTTAEPSTVRATLSSAAPELSLNKLGNKILATLQETVKSRLWSGGALWFSALFAVGWLYGFRAESTNRLRWVFTAALALLLLAQAAFDSGEGERLVTTWCAPLIVVFGAGFFFVLLGGSPGLAAWPRAAATGLLVLQGLPLAHDALEPRRIHFQYPPYFPALFQSMKQELARRDALGRFGVMADVPAGVAWYGQVRVWAQPPKLRDFYAVTLEQPIGELLLTPRTLDRPFFSELNARPVLPGALGVGHNRFGEWGEIYAGLLTGRFPGEFPLGAPQKLAENLYVLLNPALPPLRR